MDRSGQSDESTLDPTVMHNLRGTPFVTPEHARRLASLDRRLTRIDRRRARLAARSQTLGTRRLLVFVTAVTAVAVAVFTVGEGVAWTVAGLGFVVFQVLVVFHSRIEGARRRWSAWQELQRRRRARLDHEWRALDFEHHDAVDPSHPFAQDLDLVGERSFLHLIDTTVSTGGHQRLASWLLRPEPDVAVIGERQRKVAALIPARHLRDTLALVAGLGLRGARRGWDTERLVGWIGDGIVARGLRARTIGLTVLAATNVTLILGAALAGWGPWWGLTVPLYFIVYVFSLRELAPLFDDALRLQELLEPLGAVLGWLEDRGVPEPIEPVVAPLRRGDAHRPSALIARTRRVLWAVSLRTNQLLWLLVNVVVPWDFWFAMRLGATREELRDHLPRWLEALHELEALCALAEFADLNPRHVFPTFASEGPVFEARALGHPLLHPQRSVRNGLGVDRLGRVLLLTGSNMSGKSTFLRTVGLNVVLANAGSVVLADAMRLRPLRPFTCIQVSDSVNDGISYFYAEVRRLAALLHALESDSPVPQLSLIDEIYRGTNNRERWAGSKAFVEHMVERRGVTLLSTHDLELAGLADTHAALRNLHFREEVHEGRMEFDFLLREGPCPTTNALKLMEREGLPVPRSSEGRNDGAIQ